MRSGVVRLRRSGERPGIRGVGRGLLLLVVAALIVGVLPVLNPAPAVAADWVEVAKLVASDGAAHDLFGTSVAVSGERAVVGAYYHGDNGYLSGSAYVFEPDGVGGWVESAELLASDGVPFGRFGTAVAVSGDRIVVGAPGAIPGGTAPGSVYVFESDGAGGWAQVAKLLASDGADNDWFGRSVGVSGDRVVVGAYADVDLGDSSGSVYVFEPGAGGWVQAAKLTPADGASGDRFGWSVGVSADLIVVGADSDDDNGNLSGSAYVFESDGVGGWSAVAKLLPTDAASADRFGQAVAVSGDRIVVGAYGHDHGVGNAGAAYVFKSNGAGVWVQSAELLASDRSPNKYVGNSVGVSGDRIVIGAPSETDNGFASGGAYLFESNGAGGWVEAPKLLADDGANGDAFGSSVAVSGSVVVVGATHDGDNGSDSGSAYVFGTAGDSGLVGDPRYFGWWGSMPAADDPVNVASGNFLQESVDLEFPAAVFGLDWVRSYNSQDETVGPLGRGWIHPYGATVVGEDPAGVVTVRLGDGRHVGFVPDGSGGYLRPDEFYGTLEETNGSFRVDLFDGRSWDFDTSGELVSMANWDGQTVALASGADGPTSITSSAGYSLDLTYDLDGRIIDVASSDGRTVVFGYDSAGLLASVTDPTGGTTTYAYDTEGRLSEIRDAEGVLVVANVYDTEGRVVTQETAGGATATFGYNSQAGETTVTSLPSGEVTVYQHDEQGRLIGTVDSFGNSVSMTRRDDGELAGATSRLGETLAQTFDDHGNVLTATTSTGGTTTYTYDGQDRLTSMTEPFGATTSYGYESSERIPSTVADQLGNTTLFEVVDGLVAEITDPDGVTTTFAYDSQRRLVSSTDGTGDTTTYTHDAAGRVISLTSPLGHATSFTYDAAGRMSSSTDPTGAVTSYSYDTSGRLLSMTDPEGASTTYSYHSAGRLSSTTDSRGEVTSYAYDEFDQLTSTTRPGGATSSNTWGDLGRLRSISDPLGRVSGFGYDADGNRASLTDPLGNETATTRDSAGRVTSVTDPLGRVSTNTYDGSGRLVSTVDPTGATNSYTHDGLGRMDSVTDARGGVATVAHTAGGRVASITDPNGNTTSYDYDPAGRLVSVSDPEGGVTSLVYDADGRAVSATSPAGESAVLTYDPAGRPLTVTDSAGVSTAYAYNDRGNLISATLDGEATRGFSYDDRDLLSATDPLGNTTTFDYDVRGNRIGVTDPLGRTTSATFDAADQRTSVTDQLGRSNTATYDDNGRFSTVADASGRSVTNSYDAAGQLLSQTFADLTQISYTYDAAGRRTSMTDGLATTAYTYSPAGDLTSVTYPNGDTLSYTYDAGGRRTQLTYPDGSTVDYGYDGNDRLVSVTHSTAGTVAYTYDPDGRLLSETLPDGTTRSYTYTDGRLASYTQDGETTTVTYDASGRMATTTGGEDWSFGYDQAGQLTSASRDGDSFDYGYDQVGNLLSVSDPTGTRSYAVDAANQLASVTSNTGSGSFVYDEAGRLTEAVDLDGTRRTFSYDTRGLLIQEVITAGLGGGHADQCASAVPTIEGTDGPDTLVGTNGDDVIFAGAGDDIIDAGSGDDLVCAGDGNDHVTGGNGNDILVGQGGDDTLEGSNGVDVLFGGDGNDQLTGLNGNDSLFGDTGDDTLNGGQGDDAANGGEGIDTLIGDKGNDYLQGGPNPDSIDGGKGDDQCEPEPGRIACEVDLESGDPEVTVITRNYTGDGLLSQVTITRPDTTVDLYELVWDQALPIPQVVSLSVNGEAANLVYGTNRALAVDPTGTASGFEYSILGDQTGGSGSIGSEFDPYGTPESDELTVGFGYRGELHVGDLIYLRFRDLDPTTGRFTTPDPLEGQAGTATLTNLYPYANNNPISNIDPFGLRAGDWAFAPWADSYGSLRDPGQGPSPDQLTELRAIFAELANEAKVLDPPMACNVCYDYEVLDPTTLGDLYQGLKDVGAAKMDAYIDATGHIPGALETAIIVSPGYHYLDQCWGGATFTGNIGDCALAATELVGTALIIQDAASGLRGLLTRPTNVSTPAIESGNYVVSTPAGEYVGQSGNISTRLEQHVASGKFTRAEVDAAQRFAVPGTKLDREIAEQLLIDSKGGIDNLLNMVNPIGPRRLGAMPYQPYVRVIR